jgi:hypothetical protein
LNAAKGIAPAADGAATKKIQWRIDNCCCSNGIFKQLV